MDMLTFSQTLFYLVASIAIIVLGVFLTLSSYYLLKTLRNIAEISEKLSAASAEIKTKLALLIEKISNLPILSFLIQKFFGTKETHKKGRKNNSPVA